VHGPVTSGISAGPRACPQGFDDNQGQYQTIGSVVTAGKVGSYRRRWLYLGPGVCARLHPSPTFKACPPNSPLGQNVSQQPRLSLRFFPPIILRTTPRNLTAPAAGTACRPSRPWARRCTTGPPGCWRTQRPGDCHTRAKSAYLWSVSRGIYGDARNQGKSKAYCRLSKSHSCTW
jgi:hypothetical protein